MEPVISNRVEAQIAQQRVFCSDQVEVGRFRARPDDALFRCSGVPGRHLFVFPRAPVEIRHEGRAPFVADLNTVTLYNPQQVYSRGVVGHEGDDSDWFALKPELLHEMLAENDPRVDDRGEDLFQEPFVRVDAKTFLLERSLVRELLSADSVESLVFEETAIRLANSLLGRPSAAAKPARELSAAHRKLAHRAQELLAATYRSDLGLEDYARQVGCSVFHLCRVFQRAYGSSLHAYRTSLRLRAALDRIQDDRADRLVDIAFDLGYSSHSHLTSAFRRHFGVPPSQLREGLQGELLRTLRAWGPKLSDSPS